MARDSRRPVEAKAIGMALRGRVLAGAWPKWRLVSRSRTLNRRKISLMPHTHSTPALEGAAASGGQETNVNSSRAESEIKASFRAVRPTHALPHATLKSSESADRSLVSVILGVKCHSIDLLVEGWKDEGQERVYPTLGRILFLHFHSNFP